MEKEKKSKDTDTDTDFSDLESYFEILSNNASYALRKKESIWCIRDMQENRRPSSYTNIKTWNKKTAEKLHL